MRIAVVFPWARSGRLFYGCGTLCKGRFGILRVQFGLCSPFKPRPRERDGGAKEKAQTPCWGPAVPHQGGGRWEMQGWLLLQAEDAILPPGAHTGGSPFRAAPCCTLHKEAAISAPGAGCKCRVLGPASSRGRRADEREAAGPKAKQKTELRSAAC